MKQLLHYYLKTFESWIIFCYHLLQIDTFSLFQEFEKISARFLVFLLAYLNYFILKLIEKVRLPIKKWKNIFIHFLTIHKMTCQIKNLLQSFQEIRTLLFLPKSFHFLLQETDTNARASILLIFWIIEPASGCIRTKL